jgi:hypothetical protein
VRKLYLLTNREETLLPAFDLYMQLSMKQKNVVLEKEAFLEKKIKSNTQ